MNGIHLSPDTEFKPGPRPDMREPLMSTRVRHHGYRQDRVWIKVGHPDFWLVYSHYVWAKECGEVVPEGYVLHYKDRNSLNDEASNLELMTRAEHLNEHREEIKS